LRPSLAVGCVGADREGLLCDHSGRADERQKQNIS
jgi:hypothetical protein